MEKDTKLTPKYLKTVAKKFDLEIIFLLKIVNQGVSNIGSIPDCKNLLMLDLSNNKILLLNGIGSWASLTYLNISYNRISSLDPLKEWKELNTVMAQGNKIKELKWVESLSIWPVLRNLYLKEFSGEGTNPIWETDEYSEQVFASLPQITTLDGQMKGIPELKDPDDKDYETDKPEYSSKEQWYSVEIKKGPELSKNWLSNDFEQSFDNILQEWKKRIAQTKSIHSI